MLALAWGAPIVRDMNGFMIGLGGLLVTGVVWAEFPAVYNSEPGNPVPTEAADALKMLHLPEGFTATLFASEPDVQNPVGMAWDARGRMWVAENYTYAERVKRFDLSLKDRVIVLEDADHDGKAEKRTVFTDDVRMLTSVEVGHGGVWLMCPPQVLFVPDANGDDVPDGPPQVVLDGFTVAKDNYHNFANGLRWGPDGWLYGRCGHSCPGLLGVPGTPDELRIPMKGGIWRFHPQRKVVEVLTHGTTNPWGHDWDENGEMFFINTVTGHLWHLMPGAHLKDGSPSPNPGVFERLDMIADHYHFDTKGSWMEGRGGKANSLGGGHAHIGMMIYQAEQWPENFRNKLMTINMHGRRTNVERLERLGSGYVGRHEPDVFISDDSWFRGLEISTGPDGSGYILDWSDTGECHESTGVHRTSGRIFKISYGQPNAPDLADLKTVTADGVLRCLRSGNAWFDRQVRLKLAGADAPEDVVRTLRGVLAGQTGPLRLRALWTLHAMGKVTKAELLSLFSLDDEHLRVWALRLLTDEWSIDTMAGARPGDAGKTDPEVMAAVLDHARRDPSPMVRLAIASALQRMQIQERKDVILALLAHVEYAEDKNLPSMVWYGATPLVTAQPVVLAELAKACVWPTAMKWMARYAALEIEKTPDAMAGVLKAMRDKDVSVVTACVTGMSEGLKGWRKAKKPAGWDEFQSMVQTSKADDGIKTAVMDLGALFGDGRALDALRKVALDDKAELSARQAAMRTVIDARPADLREFCESLLEAKGLGVEAVKGLALLGDEALGVKVAARFKKFAATERPAIMGVLVSRPGWAKAVLKEMDAGRIARTEMSAFDARQVRAFGDKELTELLVNAWGASRESRADKKAFMEKLKTQLTPAVLAKADMEKGKAMFYALCGACHTMYGQGGKIGPDLTGSGRASLDYLLENVVDPSATIGADFQMRQLTLKDGRVIGGTMAGKNAKTITIRTLTEEVTIEKADIVKETTMPVSMMPEGLLMALQPDQVRDLLGWLMKG